MLDDVATCDTCDGAREVLTQQMSGGVEVAAVEMERRVEEDEGVAEMS